MLGRLSSIKQTGPQASSKFVQYTYDAQTNLLDSIERFEGTSASGTKVITTDFDYDGMARLTGLHHFIDDDADKNWDESELRLSGYAYTFDLMSRVTGVQSAIDGMISYEYDATGQLKYENSNAASARNYRYDESGNRKDVGSETGVDNRLTADPDGNRYTYDAEGNRLSKTHQDGSKEVYSWDHRGRLTSVTWVSPASVNTKVVTYRYDAFDRRIAKEIDLPGGNGPSVPTGSAIDQAEYFVYDGEDIALVYDEAGSLTHRYLHGPGIDNALADEVFTSSGYDDTYWLLPDHQGTIRDVVDSDNSVTSVVEHVLVDAFGFIADVKDGSGISKSTDLPMVRYVYTGLEYDAETGFYVTDTRYLDSDNGVFISKDTIGFEGGDYNLYRWVGNDAVNAIDPQGTFWDTVWDAAAVFVDVIEVIAAPTPMNVANLVIDTAALIVPGVPAPGPIVRLLTKADEAVAAACSVVKTTDKLGDAAKTADKVADAGKVTSNRAGKDFTRKGKKTVIEKNRTANDGATKCANCGKETVPPKKHEKGVTPPSNETHVDHIDPKSKGGCGDPANGQVLCRQCNLDKSNY